MQKWQTTNQVIINRVKSILLQAMYKVLLKPLFFILSPEFAHQFVTTSLKFILWIPGMRVIFRLSYNVSNPTLETEVFGIKFPNPVGLAAGFDKQADLYNDMSALGFGFIEVGTITPKPQPGNPKPRMFRLPKDEGLINRMGFNNGGISRAMDNLKNRKPAPIIGVNIGKNKTTPNNGAIADYEQCFTQLFPFADYFVVNVSSPNTPNLRELQDKEPLTNLLNSLMKLNRQQPVPKPLLLKIAPDLTNEQLDDIIGIVKSTDITGVVATNTTINREGLKTRGKRANEPGGLSGKPLTKRSTEVIKYLRNKLGKDVPIIGVGGIHSPEDAIEKIDAGADLIQIYTGFIYEGPSLVRRINKALIAKNG